MNPLVPVLIPLAAGAVGVLLTHFVLKPYLEYRKLLHEVSYTLIFHTGLIRSTKFSGAREDHIKVLNEIRSLAVKLRLSRNAALQELDLMPSDKNLKEAAGLMFRVSSRMYEETKPIEEITADIKSIGKLLKIDIGSWE